MTATIITNGANVTLQFAYTTTATNAVKIAGSAAEELYNRGLGNHDKAFAAYTNQEKANLIDAYILVIVNDLAREFEANKAAAAARAASIAAAVQL